MDIRKVIVAFFAALMFTMPSSAKSQDVAGRVVDTDGNPLPFVNVVMLSLPDSSFVEGTVTDEQGAFSIKTSADKGILRFTCIGYETLYMDYTPSVSLTVRMNAEAQTLGEVVVKAVLPKTFAKGDAMRTTVAGTILEKAGTVSDALARIPSLETVRDGAVTVLGRGEAEVYINGRKVQDIKELSRLRSDQIQHVEVVHNPGARYAASVKAVVRITLKKAQGEGLSFEEYAQGIYQYGHTLTDNIDINYRTGGFDITASLWAGRYGHSKTLQGNTLTYYAGPDCMEAVSTQESKSVWKGWSPQLQVNYMVNENHSFGAFYKYDRHPEGSFNGLYNTDNYENGIFTERSESDITQEDSFRKHIFNAYYNGKFDKLSVDFNIDGLFDDTKSPGSTSELTAEAGGSPVSRSIESTTNSGNNFWAAKLLLGYPVWKGNLSVGGEYSYNHRTDAYSFTSTDAVPVKSTDSEINEKSAALFAEYGTTFGKVFAQVGLRYEHLQNDYFNFGVREDDVCRNYGDWFPTAVVSVPLGKFQFALSYRRDIERPHYSNLTSSTIYINRYTYQSGNPYLKPTYTHSLVFNASYKWANITLNYGRVKDAVTLSTGPYPGASDPLFSLVRPVNAEEDYDRLSIVASARPTVSFSLFGAGVAWHPTWNFVVMFQNYKTPTSSGSIITLDRPLFNPSWKNTFEFPHSLRFNIDMNYTSKGEYNNFRVTSPQSATNIAIQRDFTLGSLGTLTADLRCFDVFNTNVSDAVVFGYRDITTHNPARRTFMLELTWKFNEARSKYRGSGAGDRQKARM